MKHTLTVHAAYWRRHTAPLGLPAALDGEKEEELDDFGCFSGRAGVGRISVSGPNPNQHVGSAPLVAPVCPPLCHAKRPNMLGLRYSSRRRGQHNAGTAGWRKRVTPVGEPRAARRAAMSKVAMITSSPLPPTPAPSGKAEAPLWS